MDKKRVILIVSIIVIILSVVLSVLIITNKEDNDDLNNVIEGITLPENKDILKDATVENIKITNVSLLTREGKTTYKAQAVNETTEDIDIESLYVIFYEGETQKKIPALKYTKIGANNKTYINISSESDLSKTTKIEYVLEKNKEEE